MNVTAALKELLKDIASLQKLTLATAVAGIVVPIAASLLGAHLTVAEVTGWLVLAGGVAATLEKAANAKAKPPAPKPVVPPAPPVK